MGIKALSVLLTLVGLLVFRAGYAESLQEEFYRAVKQEGLLATDYDAFLAPALSLILTDSDLAQDVQINGPPTAEKLNVLVVDATRLSEIAREGLVNNVRAVPPNTIIFDKAVIASLMLNTYNDQLGILQSLDQRNGTIGRGVQSQALRATKFSAIADFLRFRNIRNSRDLLDPELTATSLSPKIVMIASALQAPIDRVFATMLAPVVLHEMGHLRRGIEGTNDPFWSAIGKSSGAKLLEEEEAADAFAIERTRRIIKKIVETMNATRRGPFVRNREMLQIQAAISTIKYMRDVVLEDTFDNFRGRHPEDFFVSFEHEDCAPSIAQLPFINPGKIKAGGVGFIPILAQQEFDDIRVKIMQRVDMGTHAHHFIRGDQFLEMIERETSYPIRSLIGSSLGLLSAAIQNDPRELYPTLDNQYTDLSLDQLTFKLNLNISPAVNCPESLCAVGYFAEPFAGFLEVVGPMTNLRRARIMFPLFGPKPIYKVEQNPEQYVSYLVFLMRLMQNISAPSQASRISDRMDPKIMGVIEALRQSTLRCGVAFIRRSVGNRLIEIRTVNDDNWVSVDVLPGSRRQREK